MRQNPNGQRKKKDPAAVKLGRKGGKRSAASRTPEQWSALSRKGGQNRWKNTTTFSQSPAAVYQRERRRKMREEQQGEEEESA